MTEKTLSSTESLALIEKMIANTRRNFSRGGGAMFLIWGYTTLAVTVAVTAALLCTSFRQVIWLWAAIPLVGGALTWLYRRRRHETVTTHLDTAVNAVWKVFYGAALLCACWQWKGAIMSEPTNIDILFIIAMMMAAAVATTGRLIKFRPMNLCGVAAMIATISLPKFAGTIEQLPFFAGVIIVALIIPGHLLNAATRREAIKSSK